MSTADGNFEQLKELCSQHRNCSVWLRFSPSEGKMQKVRQGSPYRERLGRALQLRDRIVDPSFLRVLVLMFV
jgi:hypothetical protein